MIPTAPLGFLLLWSQQRFLVSLGRKHQVIEIVFAGIFLEKGNQA